MGENKRVFGLDALKALAAFFVVLYHVGLVDLGYHEGEYYYPSFVQMIWLFCACGVPLFYMVNGALTVRKNYDLKQTAVKVGRLLRAAVVWAIVAMCANALCKHSMSFFTIKRLSYYWFLYSLMLLYAVNYLLLRLPHWCRWVVVGLLLIFPFTTNLFWDVKQLVSPEMAVPHWGHSGLFTLYGLVYLYVGDYLLRRETIHKWVPWVCAVIGLALLALEATAVVNRTHMQFEGGNYCFPTWGALLLSIALFIWIKASDIKLSWLKRFITFLGNNALGIYIFHLLLMIVVGRSLSIFHGNHNPVLIIVIALGYVVASAGLSELVKRSPIGFLMKL